jgi:Flp pilus assembly protein TadG
MQVQELVKAKIKNKKALFYQGLFGNQKSQAVVEFALVLPFLFFLLCGMLSIGFWMYAELVTLHAAQVSVKELALTNNDSSAMATAVAVVNTLPKGDQAVITFTPAYQNDPGRHTGNIITVEVEYKNPLNFFPFSGEVNPNASSSLINLFGKVHTSASARMECDPSHNQTNTGITCPPF